MKRLGGILILTDPISNSSTYADLFHPDQWVSSSIY